MCRNFRPSTRPLRDASSLINTRLLKHARPTFSIRMRSARCSRIPRQSIYLADTTHSSEREKQIHTSIDSFLHNVSQHYATARTAYSSPKMRFPCRSVSIMCAPSFRSPGVRQARAEAGLLPPDIRVS